jgi:hypothetical protein
MPIIGLTNQSAMILVVLLVFLAALSLLVFTVRWAFPRAAARLRLSEAKLAALCALFLLLSFSTYAGWRVECPFCHAGHVDAQGRCALGKQCGNYYTLPQWDQWPEKERSMWTGTPGHYRAGTCPWCGHTGKMSRIAIWLD